MSRRVGKKFFAATATVAFALVGSLFLIQGAFAATGSIYLTPATSTVSTGGTITVSVRINPSANVNGVQATLNFDASKLTYVSTDTSGSAFSTQLQQTQSGGTVTMVRGDLTGFVSTDSLVETVTFRAAAGSGSTALTLSNANATDGTGTYTNPSTTGASVSFSTPVSPPATCPAGQTGTPPNCTTPPATGSSGDTSGGATTDPSPSQPASKPAGSTPATVTAKKVAYTSAVITTASTAPTRVYIRYGIGDSMNLQTPVSELATSHSIVLDPSLLVPGMTYSYVIVATNQQGIVSQSAPAQFKTKGLSLKIGVFDSNHKPLRNKPVTLHSSPQTVKTDNDGYAVFNGAAPGTHHVIYTVGKKTYDQTVAVVNNVQTDGNTQTAATQNFSVVYGFVQSDGRMTLWVWISIVVLVMAAIIVLGQAGRLGVALQLRRNNPAVPPLVSQPIVVGGGKGGVHAPEQEAEAKDAGDGKKAVDERLSAIPDPTRPQPGTTIMPKSEEASSNDQGIYRGGR